MPNELGPNARKQYRLIDPADDYSAGTLLFRWNSAASGPDLFHQFEIDFFDADGAKVRSPAQTLTLPILYSETWQTIAVVQPDPDKSEHRKSARHIEPPPRLVVPAGFESDGDQRLV